MSNLATTSQQIQKLIGLKKHSNQQLKVEKKKMSNNCSGIQTKIKLTNQLCKGMIWMINLKKVVKAPSQFPYFNHN